MDAKNGNRRHFTQAPNSILNTVQRLYPYLHRGLVIERTNQVWCSDIIHTLMRYGFLYLTAVMDWHSQYLISWR